MAKILFGAGVGDARGSIGAITFTKGRNGAVLRSKVSPVQPRSGPVQMVRGLFGGLSKGWQSLGAGDRVGWNAMAATVSLTNVFGNTYHPTGLQLYQMLNRNLDTIGSAHIDVPPDDLTVTGLLTVSSVPDSDPQAFSVAFTATPAEANHHVVIAVSNMYPAGRVSIPSNTYKMYAGAAAGASPADILANFQTKFGLLRAGTRIKIDAWTVNDVNGAASTPITTIATVA